MELMADFCFFDSLNKTDEIVGIDEFKFTFTFVSSTLRYVIPFSFSISELLFFN